MNSAETVLLAVTGMSPAVLTETVWALSREKPIVLPDRIVVLTTRLGAESVRREFFGKDDVWNGFLGCLRRRGVPIAGKLRFGDTSDDIRVFTSSGASGRTAELDDIRSRSDNEAMADFILEKLRSFTSNPHCRVIASIAGGRKTMGALLYACMSLVGRETDRLTHVLVAAPYDDPRLAPKFYYPGQKAGILRDREGGKHRADRAMIELADLPFVPLRNRFEDMAETPGAFSHLVARYSRALRGDATARPTVKLDRRASTVAIAGKSVKLSRRSFLALSFLIRINTARDPLPKGQIEAEAPFKAFLAGEDAGWAQSTELVNDLKRELSNIRRRLKWAGIPWMPGLRDRSLHLPPFKPV